MSKTEMVRHLSHEQAAPLAEKARSTAEAQMMLIDRLDRLALDLARLTEAQATAARQTGAAITATAQKAATEIESIQAGLKTTAQQLVVELRKMRTEAESTARTAGATITAQATAAKEARQQIAALLAQMEAQKTAFPWQAAALGAASGLMIGVLCLIGLLIWRPGLIQSLWQMAQAIR